MRIEKKYKFAVIALSLSFSIATSSYAEESVAAATGSTALAETLQHSVQGRIALDDKGFSVVPPSEWTVRRDLPRTSLFLQAVTKSESEYPRNIAVVKFTGPKIMNEVTAEEFSSYLVRNFPSSSPDIVDYQLRNHQPVQMADGREGILFYTDFKDHGRAMMQAHILVSSQTHHYLVTFTDLAEHFENPSGSSEFLAEAWESMISIELNSPNPKPLKDVQNTVLYVGIFAVFAIGFVYWRNRVAAKLYRNYGEMDPGEALELDPKTNALEDDNVLTNMDQFQEGKAANVVSFKPKKVAKATEKNQKKVQEDFPSDLAVGLDVKDEDDKNDELPRDQWKVS